MQKYSPLTWNENKYLSLELIPIELSRIFQKFSYQNTIDSSRLYNKLKYDVINLKQLATCTVDKYMLRDKSICDFNLEFESIIQRLHDNEYYDSFSERQQILLNTDLNYDKEIQHRWNESDEQFDTLTGFNLGLVDDKKRSRSSPTKSLGYNHKPFIPQLLSVPNQKFNEVLDVQQQSPPKQKQNNIPENATVKAVKEILTDTVMEMVLEMRTLNEINLLNIEEFKSISSNINILDKSNEFKILGKIQEETDATDGFVLNLEQKLDQLEKEMDLELAYGS